MIRKITVLSILFIFTLIASTNLLASNGTQIGTVGARSTAMGSCFRGLADDWSAVYYNPAGLTQLEGLTIGVSTGFIIPKGSYMPFTYPADTTYPIESLPFNGMYAWQERDLKQKTFFVPSFAISYKFSDKYTVGLGVYAPFGLGAEFDIFREPIDYRDGTINMTTYTVDPALPAISEKYETYSDHKVIDVQPTFAMEINDKLSVGLGISYIWGSMKIRQLKLPVNPMISVWMDPTLAALTTALGPINSDQSHIIINNDLEGDGSAYGINIGVHYKFSDQLSAGISARYSTDLALEGTMIQTLAAPGDTTKFKAIFAQYQAAAQGGDLITAGLLEQLLPLFSGQNEEEKYNVKADLPLPLTVGAGLAYKPTPKLTLVADVSYTNWASWDEIIVEKTEDSAKDTMVENWESTIELGLGIEYLAMESESSDLYVRGGFYTVGSPTPNETISPTILDPNRRNVITGGLGLDMGKLNFDLSVEYVTFPEKVVHDTDYVFGEHVSDGTALYIPENYAGEYKLSSWVVTLGATVSL